MCLRGGATGLLNKGGGSNRLPVEFPQVQTSYYKYITQDDLELPIPHYFTSENAKVLKERDKLLGTIMARMGPQDTAGVSTVCVVVVVVVVVVAVVVVVVSFVWNLEMWTPLGLGQSVQYIGVSTFQFCKIGINILLCLILQL